MAKHYKHVVLGGGNAAGYFAREWVARNGAKGELVRRAGNGVVVFSWWLQGLPRPRGMTSSSAGRRCQCCLRCGWTLLCHILYVMRRDPLPCLRAQLRNTLYHPSPLPAGHHRRGALRVVRAPRPEQGIPVP